MKKVSVIVPVYNEEKVINDCLDSLNKQSYSNFEVIVIDDGSKDRTLKFLKERKDILLLQQNHQGPGQARNLASKKANGEILVFVDADMTFEKSFLSKLVEPINKGLTMGTFSKEEYVSNWDNKWARCWNINESWEEKKRHPKNYPDTQKVFRAILKSEFDKVGGFTPGGYNDDWSLSQKLGYESSNASGAIFYHQNPSTLSEVFKQAKWVGKRDYKLGGLGRVIALLRVSLLISAMVGVYKAIINHNLNFILFKIVYDMGISWGILHLILSNDKSK